MAPSIIYTKASTTLTSSSNPAIHRTLVSSRIHRSHNVAVRNLWWWSRHGTWSSMNDENLEERFQRHQKIMRHRYSRALKRRAMWDRDDGSSSWLARYDGRSGRRWGACRSISSADPFMARVQEKNELSPKHQHPFLEVKKDVSNLDQEFEVFKAAVDRAVERDPYGAVFGRRLQSPPTENNSSWISWLFNLGESSQEAATNSSSAPVKRKIEIEVLDKKQPTKQDGTASQTKANAVATQTSTELRTSNEYVYDPISGRKVLKSVSQSDSPVQSHQTFLEVLFSEHGASSSKHSAKHHKVYGHNPEITKSSVTHKSDTTGFESSRKREYQQLRATTIGNSIDTTAEFGGKFEPQPTAKAENGEKKLGISPKPKDDEVPFMGTTYESRMLKSEPKQTAALELSSWLTKEGFENLSVEKLKPVEKNKLEPSFDRMSSSLEAKTPKFISKLQPALDRVQSIKGTEDLRTTSGTSDKPTFKAQQKVVPIIKRPLETDTQEDIDLLRASDIRAATKSARTTKQQAVQAKVEKRNQLENEFDQLQQKQAEESFPDAKQLRAESDRLSRSIERVRKHAEQYSDEIALKTIPSIGNVSNEFVLNDKVVGSTSPNRPAPAHDLNPDTSAMWTARSPSHAKKNQNLRVDLDGLTTFGSMNAEQASITQNAQIEQLAAGIRQVYEAEHGPIDLSLAQSSIAKQRLAKEGGLSSGETQKATTAVTTAPITSLDFFVERARFLKETNNLANDLNVVKTKTAELEAQMNDESIKSLDSSAKTEVLTRQAESIANKADQLELKFDQFIAKERAKEEAQVVKKSHPLSKATVKPGVPRYADIERHTQVFEPRYIQLLSDIKSVRASIQDIASNVKQLEHNGKSNTARKVEQVSETLSRPPASTSPSMSEASAESQNLSSPYLILVYNKTTGEVDQTPIERLPWSGTEKVEKASPIRVMDNLNYPAAFVTHFVELEKAGYELSSGGGDMLIFCKKETSSPAEIEVNNKASTTVASQTLRNEIAAEESYSQPEITETIAQPSKIDSKQAATVLEDIPAGIPTPGPAAPTAPLPTFSTATENQSKKPSRSEKKVRRQEQVFSGTLPLRSASQGQTRGQIKSKSNTKASTTGPLPTAPPPTSTTSTTSTFNHETKSSSTHSNTNTDSNHHTEPNTTIFARTTRTLKRGILGVTAFGVAAYTIGVVAEGIGAQAQVEGDMATGPRRKVVMPSPASTSATTTGYGQRPGIYSTESSRD